MTINIQLINSTCEENVLIKHRGLLQKTRKAEQRTFKCYIKFQPVQFLYSFGGTEIKDA